MRLSSWFFLLTLFAPAIAYADYAEECQSEGCNGEEVRELWQSYKEECINEGCSHEEVIELAGNPQSVNAMLNDFRSRGFQVLDNSPGPNCTATGTLAKCRFVLLMCQDWYFCPNGRDACPPDEPFCPGGNTSSAWYVCGGCIGWSARQQIPQLPGTEGTGTPGAAPRSAPAAK